MCRFKYKEFLKHEIFLKYIYIDVGKPRLIRSTPVIRVKTISRNNRPLIIRSNEWQLFFHSCEFYERIFRKKSYSAAATRHPRVLTCRPRRREGGK